ncbi:MAG: type II secretion system F family protein [Deltaproteobacteria bacterium]
MTTFSYRAKNGPSDVVEGKIEAASEKEAIEKISLKGLIPITLRQDEGKAEAPAAPSRQTEQVRLSSRQVTVLTRQLATLLKAGVPILRALRIIAEQTSDHEAAGMLKAVYRDIEQGEVLSSVIARYPRVFPPLYVAMVRAGEDSGQLPQVLFKVAEYRAREEEAIARFRTAMAYPALMAVVGFGTVVFMLAFVMPRLSRLYADMGQALPLPTRILISVSGSLKHSWPVLLIGGAALIAAAVKFLKTRQGRSFVSSFQLSLPLVRGFVLKMEMARFSRTMQLLLKSGINILRALYITLPVMGNEVLRGELARSYTDLEQGGSFGKSLRNSRFVPLFMSNLISVGEESGKLDDALSELAESYERDTEEALKTLGSLIEPALILGMGLIVGFIVIAMLLPIFEINTMVH